MIINKELENKLNLISDNFNENIDKIIDYLKKQDELVTKDHFFS